MSGNRKVSPALAKKLAEAARSLALAGTSEQAEAAQARLLELARLGLDVEAEDGCDVRPWVGIH